MATTRRKNLKRSLSKWSHVAPDQTYKSETTIEEIPDECLIHVLSFLRKATLRYKISLVSKRFYQLSMDPQLWKRLKFDPARHNIKKAMDVVQRSRCLKTLRVTTEIRGFSPFSYVNEIFKTGYLSATLTCLKVASRDEFTLPQDFFQNLSNANVRLTDLRFKNAVFPSDTEQHLACLSDLKAIKIDNCSGNIFKPLSEICKNLKSISFYPACDTTPEEWSSLVKLISRSKSTLKKFSVTEFNYSRGLSKVCALQVLEPLRICPNLEYLTFRMFFFHNIRAQWTLNHWKCIGQMANLIYLHLNVHDLTTEMNCEAAEIVFGGKRLQKLKSLWLEVYIEEEEVANIIATNCPQLRRWPRLRLSRNVKLK